MRRRHIRGAIPERRTVDLSPPQGRHRKLRCGADCQQVVCSRGVSLRCETGEGKPPLRGQGLVGGSRGLYAGRRPSGTSPIQVPASGGENQAESKYFPPRQMPARVTAPHKRPIADIQHGKPARVTGNSVSGRSPTATLTFSRNPPGGGQTPGIQCSLEIPVVPALSAGLN